MKKEPMTIERMVLEIGSLYMLRIEKWKSGKAWRAGIEWYSEDEYIFICEYDTLTEALEHIIKYIKEELL